MDTVTLTFIAADGSTQTATAAVPPVFDPSWIVAGGAIPAAPTKLWYVSPLGGGLQNGTPTNPFSAQAVFNGTLNQPYALIATMPPFYSNALKANLKGGGPLSPIQPGHGIVLCADPTATGNAAFGQLTLQAFFAALAAPNLDNGSNFIWLMQEPGVTVVSLNFIGASGWIVNGLNFVSDAADLPAGNHGFQCTVEKQADNIIIANCSFQSRTPFASLTAAQAIASAAQGILVGAGTVNQVNSSPGVYTWTTSSITNITISNNTLFNLAFGIGAQRCLNVRICYNDISQHLFDGIDWSSSNMEIDHNYIHDRLNAGISYHPDFMQGQPWQVTSTTPWTVDSLNNINIHHNVCAAATIPGLIWNSNTLANSQGVDYFNGYPTNVTFQYNLVIVNGNTQGLSMYGGSGLVMDHNTIITGQQTEIVPCIILNDTASPEVPTGTIVPATNVSITNNLAHSIGVSVNCPIWSASGNVVMQTGVPGAQAANVAFAATPGGPKLYYVTPGEANPVATISALAPVAVFETWEPLAATPLFDTTVLASAGLPAGIGAPPWSTIAPRSANWPFK